MNVFVIEPIWNSVPRDVERVVDGRDAVRSGVLLAVVEEPGDAGRVALVDRGFDRRADVVERPHGPTLSLLRVPPP